MSKSKEQAKKTSSAVVRRMVMLVLEVSVIASARVDSFDEILYHVAVSDRILLLLRTTTTDFRREKPQ